MKSILQFASFLISVVACLCSCINNEYNLNVKGLSQTELDHLNIDLKQYSSFNVTRKKELREKVFEEIKFQRDRFNAKLKDSDVNLKTINFIVGVAGSGKSTLFNFINGIPLIIKDIDGAAKLEVDEKDIEYLQQNERENISSISHRFISESTIPNFSKSAKSNTIYVDCAGEFDNKDILQSIINSYLRCAVAEEANKIKISIVVSYSDITDNRATCFNQFLKEIGYFVKNWSLFENAGAISLIVTNVPVCLNSPLVDIKNKLSAIAREVKDLGIFKNILEGILDRDAIAVFMKPDSLIINLDDLLIDKTKKPQWGIPNNKKYDPEEIGKADNIISIIETKTEFINKHQCKEKIFGHSLPREVQKVVEQICINLVEDSKQELSLLGESIFAKGDKDFLLRWLDILNSIDSSDASRNLDRLISELNLLKNQNELDTYKILESDLKEFAEISNLEFKSRVWEVHKDLKLLLFEALKQSLERENQELDKLKEHVIIARDIAIMQAKAAKKKADDMGKKVKNSEKKVFLLEKQLAEAKAKAKKKSELGLLSTALEVTGLIFGGTLGKKIGKRIGAAVSKKN